MYAAKHNADIINLAKEKGLDIFDTYDRFVKTGQWVTPEDQLRQLGFKQKIGDRTIPIEPTWE